MALLTLRILDGPDRGKTYENLSAPITVGREEGNVVRLNDERVSRFHIKILEDEGALLLADLQSTNGTKVNGETVQLWKIRPGDVVSIGRSILLVGSRDEIALRLAALRGIDLNQATKMGGDENDDLIGLSGSSSISLESELFQGEKDEAFATLHTLLPPELPGELTTRQAVQLTEIFQYFHLRLRSLIHSVHLDKETEIVQLDQRHWQNLLDLYERLALYIHTITEPQ